MPPRATRRLLAVSIAALVAGAMATTPASAGSRPPAPTSLKVVTKSPAVYVTWKSSAKRFVVQQATNRTFSTGVTNYKVKQPGHVFTPSLMRAGTTYYFRIRAVNSHGQSAPSNVATLAAAPPVSTVRVLGYNSLAANQVGDSRPGGTVAPWSDRRGPQLDLITRIDADVVGIEEGANCLRKIPGEPCYRQIDSLMDGLADRYTLADTTATAAGPNRYTGNYILYADTVRPIGTGGSWSLGPSGDPRYAAYHAFQVVATGARFLFVDTHLVAVGGSTGDRIRGEQTKAMLAKATRYASDHRITAVVYAGDFNSHYRQTEGTDYSGQAMRAAGVPDGVFVARRGSMSRYDSNNRLFRHARSGHGSIDHVFAGPGVGVRLWGELLKLNSDHDFVGTIPSDHNPTYADVTIAY